MADIIFFRTPSLCLPFMLASVLFGGCYQIPLATPAEMAILAHQERMAFEEEVTAKERGSEQNVALNVDGAIRMALQADSNIKIRRALLARTEAGVKEAGQFRNPEFRYSQKKIDDVMSEDTRLNFQLRVRPPRPGEMGARKEIARSRVRSAQSRLTMAKERVAYRIRGLFREIGFVDAEIIAAEDAIAIRERLVSLTKTRVKEGLATKMDLALVEVAYCESVQDRSELKAERDLLIKDLLRRTGLAPDASLSLDNEDLMKTTFITLPSEEKLIERALSSREELDVSASRIIEADAELYIEKMKAWPWVSLLRVVYETEPNRENEHALTAGIGIELPLLSLNLGGIEAANAEKVLRHAEFEREVEGIVRVVREQYRLVQVAEEAAKALETGARVASIQGAEAARLAMDAGQVDVRGFALIEERRASVHRKWLRALRRYSQELTKLMDAVGGDLHLSAEP